MAVSDSEAALARVYSSGWSAKDVTLDQWSGLAHKALVGPGTTELTSNVSLAPTWVGKHSRRLNAYRVLAAYLGNVARAFLPSNTDPTKRVEHREYGDPAVLVDQIVSSLLGEEQEIVVDGAIAEPEPPDAPEDLAPEATPADTEDHARAVAAYETARAEFADALVAHEAAVVRQEWIDQWADDEKLRLKIMETEHDAVGLGDGVYLLAWSNEKKRVRLRMYDPGFYFPVLDDGDDYPNRVHLAWQYEDETTGKEFVRRITFERRKLSAPVSYPWLVKGETSDFEVVLTDARWRFDSLGDRRVDDFDLGNAIFSKNADGVELRGYPIGVDFIPIVHVPNTISSKHHFGQSSITRVAQIFDDLANVDSDLEEAAAVTGAPPIAVGGHAGPTGGQIDSYGPGSVFFTGDGSMAMLDTSRSLDALLKYADALLDRLSVNGRVPAEVLGRVKASDVPSGIALLLSFGPFRALMREMRMVRADKYPLVFRFAQRLAQVGGQLPAGPDLRVELRFGSYLPNDLAGLVQMVIQLLAAHGISRSTALRIMADAGVDLGDDLDAELQRIEHEDFDGAQALADATANEDAAAKYLGVEAAAGVPPVPAPGLGVAPTVPDVPDAPPEPFPRP